MHVPLNLLFDGMDFSRHQVQLGILCGSHRFMTIFLNIKMNIFWKINFNVYFLLGGVSFSIVINGQITVTCANWEVLPELVIKWVHILGSTKRVNQYKSWRLIMAMWNFFGDNWTTGTENIDWFGFPTNSLLEIKMRKIVISAQKVTDF